MKQSSGVYQITNIVNGKRYIGSSNDLTVRHCHHFSSLKINQHRNPHLQNAYNKYGIDNFEYKVLLLCEPNERLRYEQELLDAWHPEYNIAPNVGNRYYLSEETKQKMCEAHLGLHQSEETIRKKSKSLTGLHRTEEIKYKMSETHKGKLHWNFGKHHSDETKRKMSEAQMGHVVTEETKHKMSETLKGLTQVKESKRFLGHKHTVETKRKMREAHNKTKAPNIQGLCD